MSLARIHFQRLALCAALIAATVSPVAAQSQLDTAQARAFLGNWMLPLVTDMGNMNLQLNIVDQGGKVAATFGDPTQGVMANVTDITRQGEQLLMNLMVDAQGQSIDVALQITQDGDGLSVDVAAMGGAFTANARATRSAS
ncbi:MAG: hypothetical protein FJ207_06810 [Gemmatimonadetes bacterium]|nr:hypothetical protein [Gemmatimonadota bacterium]